MTQLDADSVVSGRGCEADIGKEEMSALFGNDNVSGSTPFRTIGWKESDLQLPCMHYKKGLEV